MLKIALTVWVTQCGVAIQGGHVLTWGDLLPPGQTHSQIIERSTVYNVYHNPITQQPVECWHPVALWIIGHSGQVFNIGSFGSPWKTDTRDINFDNSFDNADLSQMMLWVHDRCPQGDWNLDGQINFFDVTDLLNAECGCN